MSWEVMRVEEKSCPCGEGNIVIEHRMDDWNRFETREFLNCESCKEEKRKLAELHEKEEKERQAKAAPLLQEVRDYFEEHFMKDWITYLATAKTKKAIWTLATKAELESKSLSLFYQINKDFNVESYARNLVRYETMLKILKVLNVKDDVFKEKLDKVASVARIQIYK